MAKIGGSIVQSETPKVNPSAVPSGKYTDVKREKHGGQFKAAKKDGFVKGTVNFASNALKAHSKKFSHPGHA